MCSYNFSYVIHSPFSSSSEEQGLDTARDKGDSIMIFFTACKNNRSMRSAAVILLHCLFVPCAPYEIFRRALSRTILEDDDGHGLAYGGSRGNSMKTEMAPDGGKRNSRPPSTES